MSSSRIQKPPDLLIRLASNSIPENQLDMFGELLHNMLPGSEYLMSGRNLYMREYLTVANFTIVEAHRYARDKAYYFLQKQ